MNVLLVDVDSLIVNLALAKLSSYHKAKGDIVKLIRLHVPYYPSKKKKITTVDLSGVDIAYFASIFKNSIDWVKVINSEHTDIFAGGTGIENTIELHPAVDLCDIDYSLWPGCDTSYGFITRGCIRRCHFCVVPQKEGNIRFEKHPRDIIKHNKVKFLDNNFLAYPGHLEILQWLKDHGVRYQFNQGLDIRLLTKESAVLLSESRYQEEVTFAFDGVELESAINAKMALVREYLSNRRCRFFVYTHPDHTISDVLYRVLWCKRNDVLPYLMRDISCWGSDKGDFYTDLAAWCNQPNLFKKMPFADYIVKKQERNPERAKKHLAVYEENIKNF
jgi:hypothetical protein